MSSDIVIREIPRSDLKPGDLFCERIERKTETGVTIYVRHVDSVWLLEAEDEQ